MNVYIGNFVHSKNDEELEVLVSKAIGVDEDGIIQFIEDSSAYQKADGHTITQAGEHQFFFPGFIDTHAHAPQYPNCGVFGDSTLLEWLETYTFPLEIKFRDVEVASRVYKRLVERQLSNGTTTVAFFGSIHVDSTLRLAQIALEKGLRAFVGRVCMERFCPDELKDATLKSDEQFIKQMKQLDPSYNLVKPIVTPRFAPSCLFSTLQGLGELARSENLPVQTHISENLNEVAWVKQLFPEAPNYAGVYDLAGLLKHDTVLAHGIHLDEAELKIIKDRNSGIAHCPNSNASLGSGIAPVKKYLRQGIKVGLGSDISGGSDVNILKNVKLSLLLSRLLAQKEGDAKHILSVANSLYLATLGGAAVLNISDAVGNFQVGKKFDAQLIDLLAEHSQVDHVNELGPRSQTNESLLRVLEKWIYMGDDRNTQKVWINGRMVYCRRN